MPTMMNCNDDITKIMLMAATKGATRGTAFSTVQPQPLRLPSSTFAYRWLMPLLT